MPPRAWLWVFIEAVEEDPEDAFAGGAGPIDIAYDPGRTVIGALFAASGMAPGFIEAIEKDPEGAPAIAPVRSILHMILAAR